MTAKGETKPCREHETTEALREAWADGFAAGRRAAFDQVLILTADARLTEEALRGGAKPLAAPAYETLPEEVNHD